jgi:hypothetical protein
LVDILKITSAIPATNRVDSAQRQIPGGAVFDINGSEDAAKYRVLERGQEEDPREALLRNLNREFFAPLKADLTAQTESLKKLILFLRFFDSSELAGKLGDIDGLFVDAKELMDALVRGDREATVFRGELFEALRVLAKAEGLPKLKDAIVNLLRAFDSQVNRDNSLKALLLQGSRFASLLREDDAARVTDVLGRLETMMNKPEQTPGLQKELGALIKSELLPLLQTMAAKYRFVNGEKLQSGLMAVVHQVVRFDKSDIKLLENAMSKLGDELKSFGRLTDDDVADMRRTLFTHLGDAKNAGTRTAAGGGETVAGAAKATETADAKAAVNDAARTGAQAAELARSAEAPEEGKRGLLSPEQLRAYLAGTLEEDGEAEAKAEKTGVPSKSLEDRALESKTLEGRESKDIAEVLRHAMEMNVSSKTNTAAQNMLAQLIENESPVFALMHFLFPTKYQGEDVYTDVYVDKDCEERKRDADEARNIFFIIQSEKFGNFEVDLLARDRSVELDIKCPSLLMEDVRGIHGDLKTMIEELGYRLTAYTVDQYSEDRNIMQRFPKLAMRKAGIDVRI